MQKVAKFFVESLSTLSRHSRLVVFPRDLRLIRA